MASLNMYMTTLVSHRVRLKIPIREHKPDIEKPQEHIHMARSKTGFKRKRVKAMFSNKV